MTWTADQIGQIPEVYRDFMWTLKPVIDSRQRVLRVEGFQLGTIADYLGLSHDLDYDEVRELAENLKRDGWITEDTWGFFAPTLKGEDLIRSIASTRDATAVRVPPLPKL